LVEWIKGLDSTFKFLGDKNSKFLSLVYDRELVYGVREMEGKTERILGGLKPEREGRQTELLTVDKL
jgi:hypothetical protein